MMSKDLKHYLGFLLALIWLAGATAACVKDPKKTYKQDYTLTELQTARAEIDRQMKEHFSMCQEKPKNRWFTLYQDSLYEFVDVKWDVTPESLEVVDYDANKIEYKGTVKLLPFDVEPKRRSYIKAYDAASNNWERNYKALDFQSSHLPETFKVVKQQRQWTLESPYSKPTIPCADLLSRRSLAAYNLPVKEIEEPEAGNSQVETVELPQKISTSLETSINKGDYVRFVNETFKHCGDRWTSLEISRSDLKDYRIIEIKGDLNWDVEDDPTYHVSETEKDQGIEERRFIDIDPSRSRVYRVNAEDRFNKENYNWLPFTVNPLDNEKLFIPVIKKRGILSIDYSSFPIKGEYNLAGGCAPSCDILEYPDKVYENYIANAVNDIYHWLGPENSTRKPCSLLK